MTKSYCNSIHIIDQNIIIPIPSHKQDPLAPKTPAFAESSDNDDILVSLAKKYCAESDPEVELLVAKPHDDILIWRQRLRLLEKLAASMHRKQPAALPGNVIPFPKCYPVGD